MCSCGDFSPHVIMARATSDGLWVRLWSDGSITNLWGHYLAVPRKITNLEIARVMMQEVCTQTRDSMGALIKAAFRMTRTKAAKGTSGEIRAAILSRMATS